MALFLGRYDLNNGRNVCNRLGLGIGDMSLLNDEAGAVFAYLGAARRHVHGMTAAGLRQKPRSNQGPNHSSGDDFCPTLFDTPTGQETSQPTHFFFIRAHII